MLPKTSRLSADLLKILLRGRVSVVRTPLFTLRYGALPPKAGTFSKFNVVVSKKEVAGAVRRNAIRRSLYRILNELYVQLTPGVFGTFIVKKEAIESPYERLRTDTKKVLKETGLFL